ncbi:MAG: VWA domain-containing protein [Planctomycetes bacterium]|nr:VWA domain-containing protein [Planctomycetota bacterium]MCB9870867.1 VWA domain-containing protein [Planctomycetota bacterium]
MNTEQALPTLPPEETVPLAGDEPGFGSLRSDAGNLPLRALDVDAQITGLTARVVVRQTFVNRCPQPLEATYIFPLPPRAAVTDFTMTVGGRTVRGLLAERGAARADYQEAIRAGQRAALAEEDRPDVFSMQVGNLMPGEEATVVLSFAAPLALVQHEACFRFPLVVAPRYIPGAVLDGLAVGGGTAGDTDRVPDASRITPPVLLPGFPNPVALSLRVSLDPAGLRIAPPRVSLHTIAVEQRTGGGAVLELRPGERLDRDFILRFAILGDAVGDSLVLAPDDPGDTDAVPTSGTFLLTLTPPAAVGTAQRPRDVVFVLDRSGSMGGWKMVAARRALARMLDTLSDRDRVAVLAFDTSVESPHDGLQAATDRLRYQAIEFLAKVEARGGTEMLAPLTHGLDLLRGGDAEHPRRDRVLVLVTDGQVGNEDELLRRTDLRDVRVFTLGIDRAVNEGFLRRFAELGGGACELVETEERLDEVMERVHRSIATPVLTELGLEASGMRIDPDTLAPARLPDLFAGAPLLLFGRYRDLAPGGAALALRAREASGSAWSRQVGGRAGESSAIPALWARGHLRSLEDRYSARGGLQNPQGVELAGRIVATSLRFGVLSRFTAFVAIDSEVVARGVPLHRVMQPVEMPEGWAGAAPACAPMDAAVSGARLQSAKSAPARMRGLGQWLEDACEVVSGMFSGPGPDASDDDAVLHGHAERAGESTALRDEIEWAVSALRQRSWTSDLEERLRQLLARIPGDQLPEELRRELDGLARQLGAGLDTELAERVVGLLQRVLTAMPRGAAFWA